jgi:phosphatidate cytidylyltransferase
MKRLLTALGLIAVALYLIWWSPQVVFVAAAICMGLLCYHEYSGIAAGHGARRPGVFGIAAGILILLYPSYTLPAIMLLLILAFCASLRLTNLSEIAPQLAYTFFGVFYTFAPWRFAIDLRHDSVHLLFFALALNWVGDTAAYYAGRYFGRHKLAPRVSPAKTWEGAIASVLASLLFGLLYLGKYVSQLPLWSVAAMAILGNMAGQLGDLAESAIKRGAGMKDSGNLLPGHGGVLDRMDSSLFSLPAVYLLHLLWIRI